METDYGLFSASGNMKFQESLYFEVQVTGNFFNGTKGRRSEHKTTLRAINHVINHADEERSINRYIKLPATNVNIFTQLTAARICTLLKALAAEGYTVPAAAEADLSVLTADEEKALIKQLAQYPVVVRLAARDYDPSFINRYLSELAAAFHKFYTVCRIKGEEKPVRLARLKLADAARAVQPGAPGQPQQQRLRLVICSMGGCDPVYPLFAQPRKAGVPQAARPVLAGMFRWTANLFGQF